MSAVRHLRPGRSDLGARVLSQELEDEQQLRALEPMAGANNLGKRSHYRRPELPLDPSMLNEPGAPLPRWLAIAEAAFYVGMTLAIAALVLAARWVIG